MKPNYLFPILHLLPISCLMFPCFSTFTCQPAPINPHSSPPPHSGVHSSMAGGWKSRGRKKQKMASAGTAPKNCSKSSPGCIWAGEYGLQRQERSFNGGCAGLQRLSSPQVVLQVPVPSCALLPNVLHHWIAASRQVMTECYVKCCPGLSKC